MIFNKQTDYTTTTAIPIKCEAGKEGYFSEGCSNKYHACIHGNGYAFSCPTEDLKYSQEEGKCNTKELVPECGRKSS